MQMELDFDIDAFLQKPLFAHLATVCESGPRESPVWFLWEKGALWLVGNNCDSFPKRIRAEPRCAVGMVEFDLARGLLRHVGIRGIGTIEPLDRPRLHRLLSRYLGADETTWNKRFREAVVDELDLMVRIDPTSIVARDQSYFSNASPKQVGLPV
jgi:nitroimidazol reductase NimA-like FMN-containing flavoprotein (pyridoxamine 5'-phosphate oxidase superfamily)